MAKEKKELEVQAVESPAETLTEEEARELARDEAAETAAETGREQCARAPGIYQALANICKNIGAVEKEKKTSGAAVFKYRGIDDVYNAIHKQLGENGVFILPHCLERRADTRQSKQGNFVSYVLLRMKYTFCHTDGSSVSCEVIGEAMDSGDKGTNKAMSIAHKYALLQMFCIPTEDMQDPDAESVELAPQNPPNPRYIEDFRGFVNEKFHKDGRKIRADLSDFFQRRINDISDLSKSEMEEYMDAWRS